MSDTAYVWAVSREWIHFWHSYLPSKCIHSLLKTDHGGHVQLLEASTEVSVYFSGRQSNSERVVSYWNVLISIKIDHDGLPTFAIHHLVQCRIWSFCSGCAGDLFSCANYITKTHLIQCWKFYNQKRKKIQIKKSNIFHIPAQNIDCRHSLKPPRRGCSNEYPQSMYFLANKKK